MNPAPPRSGRERRIRADGERFLNAFYRLIGTVRIHRDNNRMVKECVEAFLSAANRIQIDGELILSVFQERLYLQNERILYKRGNTHLLNEMLAYLKRRDLFGFRFRISRDVSLAQTVGFARALNACEAQGEPRAWLEKRLETEGQGWVVVLGEMAALPGGPSPDQRERARKTYFYALSAIKEVAGKISSQGYAGIRSIKRLIQNMVDLVLEDETLLLGLSTIRDHDDYTYVHSMNVAVLSVCMGKWVGLSRISLEQLGVSALLHDLGKIRVPREILGKPGKLTEEEWREIKRHPLASVSQILKLKASHDLRSRVLLAPFEHHLKYDLSGYPRTRLRKRISLFGRIIAIADVYDALTSPRAYRPSAYSPEHAMRIMLEKSGVDFDPLLLKVFINMMGIYPVGTLVCLDSGEIGLVTGIRPGSEAGRPRVLLLKRNEGGKFQSAGIVDLSETDPQNGRYRRNIVQSLPPSLYGIQPAHFLQ